MITEESKTLRLQEKQKGKCDVCSTDLDEDGLCPKCDLGEVDSADDDSLDESPDETPEE